MSDSVLKSIADRINRLMDERDGIGSDIRDVYAEAKSHGYIPKALRKAIARLRMDPDKRAEDDALLETYEAALGGAGKAMAALRSGATWEQAAEAGNVSRATVARVARVSKKSASDTAHDSETNEIHESSGPPEQGSETSARTEARGLTASGPLDTDHIRDCMRIRLVDHAAIEADDLSMPDSLRPHLMRARA